MIAQGLTIAIAARRQYAILTAVRSRTSIFEAPTVQDDEEVDDVEFIEEPQAARRNAPERARGTKSSAGRVLDPNAAAPVP